MIIQFIYAETDVPGPYKKEGGFKFKCAVVPKAFSLGESADKQLVAAAESTLNSALPDYAGYRAPSVGVFTSDEEFARLPKEYVFNFLPSGHYTFGRLFTCGVNHGRPGTPFHQGFVFDSKTSKQLINHLNSTTQRLLARPIDFAFSQAWKNARGEDEVNAATIDSSSFPTLQIRLPELSQWHHEAFDQSDDSRLVLNQFGQAIYDATDFFLPSKYQPLFANWISLLTHMIPQAVSWKLCFSSLGSDSLASNNGFPQLLLGDRGVGATNPEVKVWTDVVAFVFENGLDTELKSKLDDLVELFAGGSPNPDSSYRLHPALAMTLLAFLSLEDALVSGTEADEIADKALSSLLALGLPPFYDSEGAKISVDELLADGDRLFHHASKWEYCLKLLEELPVMSQEGS